MPVLWFFTQYHWSTLACNVLLYICDSCWVNGATFSSRTLKIPMSTPPMTDIHRASKSVAPKFTLPLCQEYSAANTRQISKLSSSERHIQLFSYLRTWGISVLTSCDSILFFAIVFQAWLTAGAGVTGRIMGSATGVFARDTPICCIARQSCLSVCTLMSAGRT